MKGFGQKLRDIWSHKELRDKILVTLGLILVFRIGSYIILPGINSEALEAGLAGSTDNGIMSLIALFTGGAFTRASIFALGIMPYISASIIMQLLGIAVPTVAKMQKEGESGRKKLNQWTRFLTIAITLVQAPGYLATTLQSTPGAVINDTTFWWVSSVLIITFSTLFIMWIGERITEKGVGNGISLLIMIGIIVTFPRSLFEEFNASPFYFFILEIFALLIVIGLCVMLVLAVRRVPVSAARRQASGGAGQSHLPMGEAARSYIPLKVNASGVMPIIFAQAIMFIPLYVGQSEAFQGNQVLINLSDFNGFWYNLVFAVMIIVFTYFYTAITVNPNQIADDLKRQGNFVPGVKPGRPTADFLDGILSKITLPGSIFLAIIAILPAIVFSLGIVNSQAFAYFFGGTSLLIMVGVILDTLQQIDGYLLSRHYDGLMESGSMRGRQAAPVSGIIG